LYPLEIKSALKDNEDANDEREAAKHQPNDRNVQRPNMEKSNEEDGLRSFKLAK
jgi:hypothetical protein